MEHSCHRCGTAVEDGVAFCPHCAAPQIRVAVAGAVTPAGVASETTASGEPNSPGFLPLDTAIHWPQAWPSTIRAGVIAAILMVIPLGASLGLGILAAGFLSVLFYRRRVPNANPAAGMGARLGAVGGALSFVFFGLLTVVQEFIFHTGDEFRVALIQAVEQTAARNPDPQAQQMLQYFKAPAGLVVLMIMGLTMMFILFLILSSLGGAAGAAMLRRRDRL